MTARALPLRFARPAARRGFTIVELLLAIVLLTVGMLGMAALMASSSRLQRLTTSRGELTALAEAKLEELRSYGATAPADPLRARLAPGGSRTTNVDGYADSLRGLDGRWVYRRWEVSDGIAGARQVQLRVLPGARTRSSIGRLDFTVLVALQ